MKYYIIAGEASGDLHASNLIKALKQQDNDIEVWAWGGDLMQDEGAILRKHYRDLAFMGFVEVLKNLTTILNNIEFCKKDILDFQPDALILVDYPGFNLRIAKWAKRQNIKVFYYISPQIWAWHKSRVFDIKRDVDKMFVILPFESSFYAKYDYKADFVGHPLLDAIANFKIDSSFLSNHQLEKEKPIIALLPGSRKQEIKKMLPVMLSVVKYFTDYQFVVAQAPSQPIAFYQQILADNHENGVRIVVNQTYQLLAHAKAALVTSGTATLETALFRVPQVVCYKGNELSYQIAKRLIDLKYISLVNLIMEEQVVKELIQSECSTRALQKELRLILAPEAQPMIKAKYQLLREKLGDVGASERCATLIVNHLQMLHKIV
jgi:lipid-A-disaccharide synthase